MAKTEEKIRKILSLMIDKIAPNHIYKKDWVCVETYNLMLAAKQYANGKILMDRKRRAKILNGYTKTRASTKSCDHLYNALDYCIKCGKHINFVTKD